MGMDYRYLLFFERDARFAVLERLAAMAEMPEPSSDPPTTMRLPDRTITLPFPGWLQTGAEISWDDDSPSWDFMTVLCFEPDEAIDDYLDNFYSGVGGDVDEEKHRYDRQGRSKLGFVYLSVHNDMTEWTSGAGEDLVMFEFGTPGSRMSMLFFESESIRRTFSSLLESCRGVYGLFDREDSAELFWLRGNAVEEELPTADLSLAEIENFIGETGPLAFSFGADELVATARHERRLAGGALLGVHHWLLALLGTERVLPPPLDRVDPAKAARELHQRLDRDDIGPRLPEDEARHGATNRARRAGRDLVTAGDLSEVISEFSRSVVLSEATADEPLDDTADVPSVSFWTPRNSTCDPFWRRTLDRFLMWITYSPGKWIAIGMATFAVCVTIALLAINAAR